MYWLFISCSGMAFLPLTTGFIISNLISSKLMAKYGTRIPILIGLFYWYCRFCGLAASKGRHTLLAIIFPFITIAGNGLAVPPITTSILANVGKNTLRNSIGCVKHYTARHRGQLEWLFGTMAMRNVAIVHAIGMSALISAGGAGVQRCVDIQVFENN